MYKEQLVLGVVPNKRSFLSMEEANRQKERFMKVVRSVKSELVRVVAIDDLCENGILYEMDKTDAVIDRMRTEQIDALFLPFCDFGEEQVVAKVAAALSVPVLVWGARDERPNTDQSRGRDTQCGMFAATKVLKRHGVAFSYIYNCETESGEFRQGFERFLRVVMVLKSLKGLRIAKIGERPVTFMSVMTNEAALIKRFSITTIPIAPSQVAAKMEALLEENGTRLQAYLQDIQARFSTEEVSEQELQKLAAVRLAVEELMEKNQCTVGAFECWSAFNALIGVCPCLMLGEMADLGIPMACETDVNGAITLAILRACAMYEEVGFLADLTIRHPNNDNAELLWHCGPFPYSLKKDSSQARLVNGQERFELKEGHLTVCRFDDLDGEYYLFAGEGDTIEGPETNGTYVWMEVDNWKRWEEKLMFGPYIHHLGCVYGSYLPVLREVARYLGIRFDNAHKQGIYSL